MCARLSRSRSAFESTLNSSIISYRFVRCAVVVRSGRRLRRCESTELSSVEMGSRSEGSFLPRLRPVRVPETRDDLRHQCTYNTLLRSRMHDHTSVSQWRHVVINQLHYIDTPLE